MGGSVAVESDVGAVLLTAEGGLDIYCKDDDCIDPPCVGKLDEFVSCSW